jgi:DNA-directed RNA polymerase specialized sigma24 family protein
MVDHELWCENMEWIADDAPGIEERLCVLDSELAGRRCAYALKAMSPRQRQAVVLRLWYEYTLAETGRAMGITHEAARKLVLRGVEMARGDEA